MRFQIRIANRNIQLETNYDSTFIRCADYLVNPAKSGGGTSLPDFSICLTEKDILAEERFWGNMNKERQHAFSYLEFLAVYRKIVEQMLEYNTFLMHGTAVAFDGKAYLFTAPSGTGKSTHAKLWLDNLSDAYILNGDKPLVIAGDPTMVCGTPWAGKEGWQTNAIIPLDAIVLMERSENNEIERITFSKAFPDLLRQTFHPNNVDQIVKTIALIKSLEKTVKVYSFKFNNTKNDAFQVAYNELIDKA